MLRFFKKNKLDSVTVDGILFLGEQNGLPELKFKARILNILDESGVRQAHLARLRYIGKEQIVGLCLSGQPNDPQRLAERIASEFRPLFKPDQSLDIVSLTPAQEAQIAQVCRPFCVRHVSTQ